jgi:hypothetical protein
MVGATRRRGVPRAGPVRRATAGKRGGQAGEQAGDSVSWLHASAVTLPVQDGGRHRKESSDFSGDVAEVGDAAAESLTDVSWQEELN